MPGTLETSMSETDGRWRRASYEDAYHENVHHKLIQSHLYYDLMAREAESEIFQDMGVEAITSMGQELDPNFHEAVAVDESTDVAPNTVTAELLRVVEPMRLPVTAESRTYVVGRADPVATQKAVQNAEAELAPIVRELEHGSGCDVYPHVVIDDHAGRGIVRFAKRFNASLVAMTTHGRGASRLVMGSVADVVLRTATIPLLLLHPAGHTNSGHDGMRPTED